MIGQLVHVLWGRVGMAACRVIALMVLAHHLVPADLGRFSFLIIMFVVFTSITSLGVAVAGPVLVAEAGIRGRRLALPLFGQALICGAGSVVLLLAVRILAAHRLFEGIPASSVDLLLLSLLPGQLVLAETGYLSGRERFSSVSLLGMVQWGGYLLSVIVATWRGPIDLAAAAVCFLGPVWLAAVVGAALVARDAVRAFRWVDLRALLSFGWRSQLAQVLNLLQMRLDMILLRVLTSPEQLGYYSVATNLSEWMLYLPRALQQVAVPRSARKDEIPARVYGWLFGIMTVAACGVGIAAPWLVRLFFGAEYLPAVPAVRVILPGTVMLGLGTLATGVLFGRRDTMFLVISGVAVAVLFLLADLWAVPRWGAFGAAAVSCVLYAIYAWILLRRLFAGRPGELGACFLPSRPWRRPVG